MPLLEIAEISSLARQHQWAVSPGQPRVATMTPKMPVNAVIAPMVVRGQLRAEHLHEPTIQSTSGGLRSDRSSDPA
jgi:hypothetical protein